MSEDRKASTEKAMLNYIRKNTDDLESNTVPKKQRQQPERKVGVKVDRWCRENGLEVHEVEASKFDRTTGQMGEAKAEAGYPDRSGNTPQGLAVYIELKALGQRHGLSETQRDFLIKKINSFCFAVVVDSDVVLETYWHGFCALKTPQERKEYLLSCLPRQYNTKKRQADKKKQEEFGF